MLCQTDDYVIIQKCYRDFINEQGRGLGFFKQNDNLDNDAYLFTGIIILGFITLLGFFLMLHRKLQIHPYGLYSIEILTCVAYYYNYFASAFRIDASYWARYLMFFNQYYPPSRQFFVFALIHVTNNRLMQVLATLYPLMNLLLYIDLYWIMRDPFLP